MCVLRIFQKINTFGRFFAGLYLIVATGWVLAEENFSALSFDEKPTGVAVPFVGSDVFYVTYPFLLRGVRYQAYACSETLSACLQGKQEANGLRFIETQDRQFQTAEGYQVGQRFEDVQGLWYADGECKQLASNWLACRALVKERGKFVFDNAIYRFVRIYSAENFSESR